VALRFHFIALGDNPNNACSKRIVKITGLWLLVVKPGRLVAISGLSGILCPVVTLATIGTALYYAPWFSWTNNSLSDLAGTAGETPIWAARGVASAVFNTGLVADGILTLIFAIGLRKNLGFTTRLGNLGTLMFILGACALAGIGIFPKTMGRIHYVFSTSFFPLVPLSILLIGMAVLKSSDKVMGWFTIALGITGLCSLLIPWPWKGEAIPDAISIFPMMVFAMVFGTRLLKRTAPHLFGTGNT